MHAHATTWTHKQESLHHPINGLIKKYIYFTSFFFHSKSSKMQCVFIHSMSQFALATFQVSGSQTNVASGYHIGQCRYRTFSSSQKVLWTVLFKTMLLVCVWWGEGGCWENKKKKEPWEKELYVCITGVMPHHFLNPYNLSSMPTICPRSPTSGYK